jgi:hypothetical protein
VSSLIEVEFRDAVLGAREDDFRGVLAGDVGGDADGDIRVDCAEAGGAAGEVEGVQFVGVDVDEAEGVD